MIIRNAAVKARCLLSRGVRLSVMIRYSAKAVEYIVETLPSPDYVAPTF